MRFTECLRKIAAGLMPFAIGCAPQPTTVESAAKPSVVTAVPSTAQESGGASAVSADPASVVAALTSSEATLRKDPQGSIIEVDLRGKTIDNELLDRMVQLPRLRSLILAATKLVDEQLIPVGRISTLENLDLRDCPVTDKGMSHLTGLSKLKSLRLSGKSGACTVGDEGMKHVGTLSALKVLAADNLWISEDGLKSLTNLKNLQELYLAETTIGDDAIELLSQFTTLRKLRLAGNQISAAGLKNLPKLRELEELDLSECSQILDDAMAPFAEMKKLKKLNLWRVNLSDKGIEPLAGLAQLESLNLDNTRLSDGGMKYLGGMTKLTFLHLGSTLITDSGLSHLNALKSLKDLKLTRTAVTQKGVDELKMHLPSTAIQLEYIAGE